MNFKKGDKVVSTIGLAVEKTYKHLPAGTVFEVISEVDHYGVIRIKHKTDTVYCGEGYVKKLSKLQKALT